MKELEFQVGDIVRPKGGYIYFQVVRKLGNGRYRLRSLKYWHNYIIMYAHELINYTNIAKTTNFKRKAKKLGVITMDWVYHNSIPVCDCSFYLETSKYGQSAQNHHIDFRLRFEIHGRKVAKSERNQFQLWVMGASPTESKIYVKDVEEGMEVAQQVMDDFKAIFTRKLEPRNIREIGVEEAESLELESVEL